MAKLEAKNVTKVFKKKTGIDHLSVTFDSGRIYGLLGRNSAGKTTLLRLLTTQLLPTSGQITYDGKDVYENQEALEEMCLFMDDMPAFQSQRIKHLLCLGKTFYKDWSEEKAEHLLEVFELEKEESYTSLSKGKKSAVAIVLGIASGCEITMFDEIYSGLDAVMRQRFYEVLREEYADTGRTFILSTHLIDEMDRLFTDVVIMKEGKVIVNAEAEALQESVISVRGTKEQLEAVKQAEVLSESSFAGTVTRIIRGSFNEEMLFSYKEAGLDVKRLSLQDIFIAITEQDRGKDE